MKVSKVIYIKTWSELIQRDLEECKVSEELAQYRSAFFFHKILFESCMRGKQTLTEYDDDDEYGRGRGDNFGDFLRQNR